MLINERNFIESFHILAVKFRERFIKLVSSFDKNVFGIQCDQIRVSTIRIESSIVLVIKLKWIPVLMALILQDKRFHFIIPLLK